MPKKIFFGLIVLFLALSLFMPTIVSAACDCACTNGSTKNAVADENACDLFCAGVNQGQPQGSPTVTRQSCNPTGGGAGTNYNSTPGRQVTIEDPLDLGSGGLGTLYARLIAALLGFVGIASLVTFVYAGFIFVFSGGSAEKIMKAKNTMLFAVIGIAVSIASYAILSFIFKTLETGTGN